MNSIDKLDLKLGKKITENTPATLDAVPRSICRDDLDLGGAQMYGADIWNAYEVTFLLPPGKPMVFLMRCVIPATSPNLVESKSLKLFLFDQANRIFDHVDEFTHRVQEALQDCVGSPVTVTLFPPPPQSGWNIPRRILEGIWLDPLPLEHVPEGPDRSLIEPAPSEGDFHCFSHLIMTRCPVTGQPDYGSIQVRCNGPRGAEPESLLRYLLAFRHAPMFHETFCERVWLDLAARLRPKRLDVSCFFNRRGGIDINPIRSSHAETGLQFSPTWRQ